jgi:quinoprotein dehydrogenase-associated probable ABC transporter substrate-binding protein
MHRAPSRLFRLAPRTARHRHELNVKSGIGFLVLVFVQVFGCAVPGHAARELQKDFDEMTSAEKTAARRAARKVVEEKSLATLNVCADPGNMPLSDINGNGYQNKIIKEIADAVGARVAYFWRPYLERGLTRQTFDVHSCDVLLDVPAVYDPALTTYPVYRSTYVLAHRKGTPEIENLDDPALKDMKIGVFQTSAMRQVLTRKGLASNLDIHPLSHDADLKPEHQPWRQVQDVIDGKLDAAAVWGPFAGWLKTMKNEPIVIQPANLWDDYVPLEYDLSFGVRRTDARLKYILEFAMEEKRAEIEKIMRDYGVPLVECSTCLIQGDLPAHGAYTKLKDRVFKSNPEAATPDQIVTQERVEHWLEDGADLTQELANATLASDQARIEWLVKEKGADINAYDPQGYAPLHTAARNRHPELAAFLVGLGADVDAPDRDGMTPLIHAAMRKHVPTVKKLLEVGADIEKPGTQGYPPLALAIGEAKFEVAKALMESGADIDKPLGPEKLTPLMVAASQVSPGEGSIFLPGSTRPIDIARALIKSGANVNAQSKDGVTALMIAAARNVAPMIGLLVQAGADPSLKNSLGQTAADIADQNGAEAAGKALRLLASVPDGKGSH